MGDTKTLGKMGLKTMLFYLVTTTLAIMIALCIANVINPGQNLNMQAIENINEVAAAESPSLVSTILNIIPSNIFQGLSEGVMLQIIFFALILGILLAQMGNERVGTIKSFFNQFNEVMMEMTMMMMRVAPIGVFCLISKTFSEIGFEALLPMLKYVLSVSVALLVQCFILYMLLLKIFTGLSPIQFLKNFFPVMAFAFSTASSSATIPMSLENLTDRMGVSKKVSAFTIPLGATINMDGTAIMQGVAVVFAAQAFGIDLTLMDYAIVICIATLASIGTAGVPGVALITLTMVFTSVGLPIEAIAFIMGIDRIVDMSRTMVNITGDAVCTTVIAYQSDAFDRRVFNQRAEQ